jgi:hypothetical protein
LYTSCTHLSRAAAEAARAHAADLARDLAAALGARADADAARDAGAAAEVHDSVAVLQDRVNALAAELERERADANARVQAARGAEPGGGGGSWEERAERSSERRAADEGLHAALATTRAELAAARAELSRHDGALAEARTPLADGAETARELLDVRAALVAQTAAVEQLQVDLALARAAALRASEADAARAAATPAQPPQPSASPQAAASAASPSSKSSIPLRVRELGNFSLMKAVSFRGR